MKKSLFIFSLLSLFVLLFSFPVEAEKEGLTTTDFSYHGVALGDTEQTLLEKYPVPLYDLDKVMMGVPVKVYFFHGHTSVAVSKQTYRVVDFSIPEEDFSIRGVRRGATSYWIMKKFGKSPRVDVDGKTAYVYSRQSLSAQPGDGSKEKDRARIVFFINLEQMVVESVRLTSLPLTQDEVSEATAENTEDGDEEGMDMSGKIDVSALPKEDEVRLGGLF